MKSNLKRLGVIGGLGPETCFKFCLNINDKFRDRTNSQPDLVVENLAVSTGLLKRTADGEKTEEMFRLLKDAVERLNQNGADFIAIPCNSVHVFIQELRNLSKVPILSIIEETAKECRRKKIKIVGLLASSSTINHHLYHSELQNSGIELIVSLPEQQEYINNIILKIIAHKSGPEDRTILLNLAEKLIVKGSEAIILGCTDLRILLSPKDCNIPFIETTEILEVSAVNSLLKIDENDSPQSN